MIVAQALPPEAMWVYGIMMALSLIGNAGAGLALLMGRKTQIAGKVQVVPADKVVQKEDFDAKLDELKDLIEDLDSKFEDSKKYQAKARQLIHRRQNNVENILSYMAGKAEASGDMAVAKFVQERLQQAKEGEDDV